MTGARVARVDLEGFRVAGEAETLDCDTIASSGGYSPVIHLASHTGARPTWREDILGFVPNLVNGVQAAGGRSGSLSHGGSVGRWLGRRWSGGRGDWL